MSAALLVPEGPISTLEMKEQYYEKRYLLTRAFADLETHHELLQKL